MHQPLTEFVLEEEHYGKEDGEEDSKSSKALGGADEEVRECKEQQAEEHRSKLEVKPLCCMVGAGG
ncbi:uncharacterized protein K460DRAFT_361106 [Cucurbitaria berberidis CBS 394.84]|uniref:Uncharacterized protein n=1 Tax=Cucurbitaria berberidis CBS 394.84 TaxID=1168544 RepID=A0A9P4GSK4_9PLEO|nr:uncharacterized protein K460DRAFT_361106 [Cucurbitaria berberidis CBS 394.84]KAF1850286.1 hypothetical protein K460DRAFT_361106 [Cucurbitaria berberidis CBS 394.84]